MRVITKKNKNGEILEIKKYNDKNKLVYEKTLFHECIFEYDENGNEIYCENLMSGYKRWSEYNNFGKLTHYINTYCNETWNEYVENGNLIHTKSSSGTKFESWMEYDKNNNMIHIKYKDGHENFWKYDEQNRLIFYKEYTGLEYHYEYSEE